MRRKVLWLASQLVLLQMAANPWHACAVTVLNFGFETPSVGGGYQYNPSGSSWTFNGASPNGSGLVGNGSAFANPGAPQGVQAAFVQRSGIVSQAIPGFTSGTLYMISFYAAQRPNNAQSWNVTVNGTVVASFNPGASATSYANYTTTFMATAASQTVAFVGTDLAGGDNTIFIDNVQINSVSATVVVSSAPTATPITYSQALASSTLSGGVVTNSIGVTVAGSFAWTRPANVPTAGTSSQSVTFTPSNSSYNPVTFNVSVTVSKQTPTLKPPTATSISYGQTLAGSTLSGGAATNSVNNTSVAGTFAFTTPTNVPAAGTSSQSVTFTPADTADYNLATVNVRVTVIGSTVVAGIIVPTATAITYGQTVASSTLSGGAATNSSGVTVDGTFAFTTSTNAPPVGTFSQPVMFAPTNPSYNPAMGSVNVTVNKQTPIVASAPAATAIAYSQILASSPLSGGAVTNAAGVAVAGSFAWTTPTNAPAVGTPNQSVTFTPTDTTNYNPATGNARILVYISNGDGTTLITNTGMFCELLNHPEETVINAENPRFTWDYLPTFRNEVQTGYRIIVASSQALASAGTGNMWDSGIVTSSNSLNLVYGGAALQANTSYFWRVQTVNSLGQVGAFSAIQQFKTAGQLFNPVTQPGVVYQLPSAGSANCYPLRYVAVSPVLVTNTASGTWFIDFGKDAEGYANLTLNGSYSGMTINYGLGELNNGANVNTNPNPGGSVIRYWSGSVALQNGNVTYPIRSTTAVGNISPPTATYGIVCPFRYLQLTGVPAGVTLTTNSVTQQRLQTEFDDNAAAFSSSNTNLNQIWALCKYSMKALTFDGIYVDGDRERSPYEADTYIHMMSSYGVDNEFTAPRITFEYLTNHMTWPTEWKFHMILAAWADYQQTGDPYLMTKYYGFLTNKCMMLPSAGPDGLVQSSPVDPFTLGGDIIDWFRISGDGVGNIDGYVAEATNAVINAFYYRCLTIMSNAAQLTGHAADAANFSLRASQMYSSYNNNFWNSGSQSYIDGEGTTHSSANANFFPLAFGLVPATNQTATVNYLHSRIAAKGGMPAGVYGAQYLLEGMFLAGDADAALGLMTTNSTRSWMNMINIGSTITCEAWSTADNYSEDWNHAWGAAPGNLIPRYVLGVRPITAGYGQILIQPQLGQKLSYVQGTVPTIRGPVAVTVTNGTSTYQMLLTIPGNVTATVMLPTLSLTNPVALLDGVTTRGAVTNGWMAISNIGGGQHAIWLSSTNSLFTNNPPVASGITIGALSGIPVKVQIVGGANPPASNPNGNSLTVSGVTAPAHGLATTDGTNITFTATTNYLGSDNFIYTVSDPQGAVASALVTVNVVNSGLTYNMILTTVAGGNVTLTYAGIPGYPYVLEQTYDLTPPAQWHSLVTNTADSYGNILFTNLPTASAKEFYRILGN
jgi:alpha-L-rhamnosidase